MLASEANERPGSKGSSIFLAICAAVSIPVLTCLLAHYIGADEWSSSAMLDQGVAYGVVTALLVAVLLMRVRTLRTRLARTRAELTRTRAQLSARIERYKLTLRAIDDVIIYWNGRTSVLRWSANGRRYFGGAPRSCKAGRLLKRCLDERDRDRVLRDLRGFLDRNEAVWQAQFTLKCRDGAPVPVSVRGILVRDAAGRPRWMIGAITDMTDTRVAAESARALARAARLATVGEITASITHEVNQPLAAILNNAETGLLLLQRKRLGSEILNEILEDIRADAVRASETIRRTRALLQDKEIVRSRVNVNKLVMDAVDLLWLEAQRRRATLIASPGSIPAVAADEVHLQQVLINLITNALDAVETSEGIKRVEVSTAHHLGRVTLRVADTGCGIPPTQLAVIFDSFNTTKANGLGMGLAIARSIVKAHGGRIFAENNQFGPGATVTVELPVGVEATALSRLAEPQRGEC